MPSLATDDLSHYRLAARVAGLPIDEFCLPEGHQMIVEGLRLHYLDWGNPGCPDVVFLHGGGLNAHTWDLVCLALRHDYRCIALDQRGHGDSEWSPEADYRVESHVKDLEGFIDRLGLDRFLLIGHSMGAVNAYTYARRHGDRLAGLVLVDSGPGPHDKGAAKIIDFIKRTAEVDSIEEFIQAARSFNSRRDERLLGHSVRRNLRLRPDNRLMRKHDVRHLVNAEPRKLAADHDAVWIGAESVTCPVLVVRGTESAVFPSDSAAERFAKTFPRGEARDVEKAGHTVQGDNPAGLCRVLADFLGRCVGAG